MGKFEVQIEGCMGYITFWDNLSPNGLCRPTKALYEDFDLKTKIWSKSSLDQKNVFGREERSKERKLGFCRRNQEICARTCKVVQGEG